MIKINLSEEVLDEANRRFRALDFAPEQEMDCLWHEFFGWRAASPMRAAAFDAVEVVRDLLLDHGWIETAPGMEKRLW